jgi:cupin superfamily acireductone dioxygenase involved in methionine salvage
MSWEQKRYVTKIFNAFKRNKERIYKEDIEALKNLDEFINESSKNLTKDNLIYAKLLCVFLRQNVHHYKDIKFAIKELKFQLNIPLDRQIELLTYDLNLIELQKLDSAEQIFEKMDNAWSKEQVEKSFYNSANDLLKEIENYS